MTESVSSSSSSNNIFGAITEQTQQAGKDLGRDEFLVLLTEQMKAQNPLEPTGNTEFVAQLATFSQLEQLTNISGALEASIETDLLMTQSITNLSATTLIGRTVKMAGDTFNLKQGDSANIQYNLFAAAQDLTVEIRDSSGNLVRTLTPPQRAAGDNTAVWDGRDNFGGVAPSGKYTYSVKAVDRNGIELETTTFATGKVESIDFSPSGASLLVDGQRVSLGNVLSVLE